MLELVAIIPFEIKYLMLPHSITYQWGITILQSSANAMQIQNAIYLPFLNAQNFRHYSF